VLNRITTHEKYLIDSERSSLHREEWLRAGSECFATLISIPG